MIAENEIVNFEAFRDCTSTTVIEKLAPSSGKSKRRTVKGRKNEIKPVTTREPDDESAANDAADLADFVEYLAEEIFLTLPTDLRTLCYAALQDSDSLALKYSLPLETSLLESIIKSLPPTIADSLLSYGLIDSADSLDRFLDPILTSFISTAAAVPPEHTPALTASRPDECEICAREHLPLTYHHLIPHQAHAKAVKRGWHREWELNKVAWLCRACHSYVHKIATNEELAKEYYDVELLMAREDVQKWAAWVGKVRWKAR